MKKLLILLLALLIIPVAYSQDIVFYIDGQELGKQVELIPGSYVELEIMKNNVAFINSIDIKSESPIYEQVFYNYISNDRSYGDYYRIQVPEEVPDGDYSTTLYVDYYDRTWTHKRYTKTAVLSAEGSKAASMLPAGAASAIVNKFTGMRISRLNPALVHTDLTKSDLVELEIEPEEFVECLESRYKECLPEIEEVDSKIETLKYDDMEIPDKYLKLLKGKLHPDVVVTTKVYEVSNGDNVIDKSKVTYSVTADEELFDVEVLVVVPKDIAGDVKELVFSEMPEVIEKDPVIKWAFKNIPQGQTKDYAFTVSKDVQNFDTLAVAAADNPSWLTRLIRKIIEAFA
ncbi:hypothetical protein KY337_03100 [Candidatus Woesearchaeota archaeon]|nr:hypothetical protein [Candidatus Woesearchaeota archaeon]